METLLRHSKLMDSTYKLKFKNIDAKFKKNI